MNVNFFGASGKGFYSIGLNVTEDYYRELKSLLKIKRVEDRSRGGCLLE